MSQRAWTLPRGSLAFAGLICFAQSTQLLFQRALYQDWSAVDIVGAWLRSLADMLIIGGAIVVTLAVAGRMPARNVLLRVSAAALAMIVGAFLGEWMVLWLEWGTWPEVPHEVVLTRALRWLPIGAVSGAILFFRQRAGEVAAQLHETEVTRLQLEQQRVRVELQVLQSQIEPHFLFNTLATIRRLHQTDPARGRTTLAHFIHYLKSALPEMRAHETTLGREVDLITAYLDVLRVRMGTRLGFEIDVPPALRVQRIPPLSLATLVENAIKHGLSGLPEGGTLLIRARIDGGNLIVRVADTGIGLSKSGGTGTGLANLRVRLRALYGDAGRLVLESNDPRGLTATLLVPASLGPLAESHVTR